MAWKGKAEDGLEMIIPGIGGLLKTQTIIMVKVIRHG